MTTTGGEPKYSARGGWATTARVVRHDHAAMTDVVVTKLEPTPPPVLANPPRPHSDLSTAGAAEIITIAEPIWATSKTVRTSLRGGIKDLLAELEKAPGDTWQQRWEALGFNDGTLVPADLGDGKKERGRMTSGSRILFCLRVVRPSHKALRAAKYPYLAEHLRRAANDPLLDKFFEYVRESGARDFMQRAALIDVAQCLTVFDISLRDLAPGILLHYAVTHREVTGYRHTRSRERPGSCCARWASSRPRHPTRCRPRCGRGS
ncbi:hypothetical protein EV643_1652 [Kribbella sp. VKM Ac-2527]|uniref:Uncharacterized protein n=1 Tax=Kribbella caucasensis TaxID=2512215 RepID=A0A4R6IUH5_9ACTN|nr:hypothetical protein [Kribbella sp. VKM Ac-2527]TDO26242.1 hypothetical protein EV643_1652 [Kribbella sp. VKM Ac-2527]